MEIPARPTWEELRQREQDSRIRAESRQLATMHLRHGTAEGKICGDCAFLVKHIGDHAIQPFKCHKFRVSSSSATDWRLKWTACGLFVQRSEA